MLLYLYRRENVDLYGNLLPNYFCDGGVTQMIEEIIGKRTLSSIIQNCLLFWLVIPSSVHSCKILT